MLRYRILAATGIVLILIGAMWVDFYHLHDSIGLHVFFLVAAFLSFREFWPMCRAAGHQTFSTWGTFSGCMLVVAHYWWVHMWTILHPLQAAPEGTVPFRALYQADNMLNAAIAFAVLGAFVLTARRRDFPASLGGMGVTCLGLIYIWFLPSFVLKLRHMGEDGLFGGPGWNTFGHGMVIATVVVAKGCDVFAYLVGRKVGKHKAFPLLSPGKTIEGVAAGMCGSVLLAFVLRMEPISILPVDVFGVVETVLFGLIIGFSGMMGDLAESLLKRSAGVKDASQIVPGFGGVLDVVDSLVVAGPVAYFMIPWLIRWHAP